MSSSTSNVTASLGNLNIDDRIKSRKAEPLDSWEDDDGNDSNNANKTNRVSTPVESITPRPPPPTPSSPTAARDRQLQYQNFGPLSYDEPSSSKGNSSSHNEPPERRPDKTTSVASRLIAAGLGQRAPKRTPEQREYDQAMKVQEKKKRDQKKAEEERLKRETEDKKRAIWED